jgi:hypothetical protein
MTLRRLPRLRRRVGTITALSSNKLRVFDALTYYTLQSGNEAAFVAIFILALVKAESLFIEVSEQMKRLYANISPLECAFQKRPKILKAVSVNVAVRVANRMVNHAPVVIHFEIVIGHERIGANRRACFDVLANVAAKLRSARVRNDLENYTRRALVSCALKDALHGGFLNPRVAYASPAMFVHEAGLSADVGFVRFTGPAHLINGTVVHRQADALQHEPRGLLRNTNRAMQFIRANAVLAVSGEPHGREPLVQTDRRIFKDRSDLGGKLLLWMCRAAFPDLRVLKERHLVRTAARAGHTFRPANLLKELESVLWIAEIRDCFEQGFRCLHTSTIRP